MEYRKYECVGVLRGREENVCECESSAEAAGSEGRDEQGEELDAYE